MMNVMLMLTVQMVQQASAVEFKDIQDLLKGVDGNDPLVQEILRDEVSRMEASLDAQRQTLREAEIESQEYARKVASEKAMTDDLTSRAKNLRDNWKAVDEQFRNLVKDFENTKTKELSRGFHIVKIRFLNELLGKYDGFVKKLSDQIPAAEGEIFNEASALCRILDREKRSVQSTWRDTAGLTNQRLVEGVESNLQAIGASSSRQESLPQLQNSNTNQRN